MNQQLEDLIDCYDAQASHFHNTRWFHKWPELDHIWDVLDSVITLSQETKKWLSLLDLWCGTGRISEWLDLEWYDQISYKGVDISPGMIDQAKKNYPSVEFEVADMSSYLQTMKQQSIDVVLCLASYHHLQTRYERLQALHNLYRILDYGGIVILVNRSFSHRFLEKYYTNINKAILKSIGTLWASKRNDIIVPWKDPDFAANQEIHHRFYHMFTLQELKKIISTTDFQVLELCYINQEGKKNYHRPDSRNSFIVLRK